MAKLPAPLQELTDQFGPHLSHLPLRWLAERIHPSDGPACKNALLLLRPAMRHSTKGSR
jgi:hypothetical protein